MSNDEYQQRRFCQDIKPLKPKMKISVSSYRGLTVGIHFPFNDYVDITLCILCWGIHFKWRKR